MKRNSKIIVILVLVLGLVLAGFLIAFTAGKNGTVMGVVSVGPTAPQCPLGKPCTVNMTGYSLLFTQVCSLSTCYSKSVVLSSNGEYSISLPASNYTVTINSCPWLGCSASLPRNVIVVAGQTITLDITIDTGIRAEP